MQNRVDSVTVHFGEDVKKPPAAKEHVGSEGVAEDADDSGCCGVQRAAEVKSGTTDEATKRERPRPRPV